MTCVAHPTWQQVLPHDGSIFLACAADCKRLNSNFNNGGHIPCGDEQPALQQWAGKEGSVKLANLR